MRICDLPLLGSIVAILMPCSPVAHVSPGDLDKACEVAETVVRQLESLRRHAHEKGFIVKKGPSRMHQETTHAIVHNDFPRNADIFNAIGRELFQRYNMTSLTDFEAATANSRSPRFNEIVTRCRDRVESAISCERNGQKWLYSYDGRCNNVANPRWGMTNTCLRRLLPAVYEDGIEQPRMSSSDGQELPNPRHLSHGALQSDGDSNLDLRWAFNRMAFGQFIAHDITLTPTTTTTNGQPPDCCNPDNRMTQCNPILEIHSANNSGGSGQNCMNFVRSIPCPTCALGARQQMNAQTPFIDLSHQYGTNSKQAEALRLNNASGLLRGQLPNSRVGFILLPPSNSSDPGCRSPTASRACFLGGDVRVNQQIGITALSTIFFRYHNVLATRFRLHYPSWSGQRIFDAARKISIAQMQIVVYREWLPSIIGQNMMRRFRLNRITTDRRSNYDRNVHPQLFNEFATAAMRFGHTMIRDVFKFVDSEIPQELFDVPLKDSFSSGSRFLDTNGDFTVENLIYGLLHQYGKPIGPSFVSGVNSFLYSDGSNQPGLDLPAFNIHRGREHGLGPYVNYYKLFNGVTITSWSMLENVWYPRCIQTLPLFYRSRVVKAAKMSVDGAESRCTVDVKCWLRVSSENVFIRDVSSVDLYVGGICEKPLELGSLGPTFAEIVAMQFHNLMYGDRLFVSHKRGSFNDIQFKHLIESTALTNIFCEAGLVWTEIPASAFDLSSFQLHDIECDEVPQIKPGLFTDV